MGRLWARKPSRLAERALVVMGAIVNTGAAQVQALDDADFVWRCVIQRDEPLGSARFSATLNMGGFTLSVTGGTPATGFHLTSNSALSGVTVTNPGNFIVLGTASLHIEQATTLGGSAANTITLNTGTYPGDLQ